MEQHQPRNQTVDILRGIAILMVVMGHTISGSVVEYENTFLFNIIWTLQMPLFMLISGYVTRYSRSVTSGREMAKYIRKKTIAYLIPWAVWSFVIRGMIFGESAFFDVRHLVYNMDSGYWFLFTLWTISILFGISQWFGEKFCAMRSPGRWMKMAVTTTAYVCGMILLAALGIAMGMSFLCIKLTLYYMPFYFAGYLWGQFQPEIEKQRCGKQMVDICVALCLLLWVFLMNRYCFYVIDDDGSGIILRAVASLSGCIAVCGLISSLVSMSLANRGGVHFLRYVGSHSLELYLIHYLLLSMLKVAAKHQLLTVEGFFVTMVNYVLTVVVSLSLVQLVNSNRVLPKLLFGKN